MSTNVIDSGIEFLREEQQTDGSFLSLSSPDPVTFQQPLSFHSVFPTALILLSLLSLDETPTIAIIKEKAAKFLLSQKNKYWSFNYWARGSEEAKTMPLPDDLDDTFCALSALFRYKPKLFTGSTLAKITLLLTTMETKEGGPYRTWFVGENAPPIWKDTDIVVNTNIAYFLSLQDIELPNVTQLLETAISRNKLTTPYYPTPFPFLYFLSRFYTGKKAKNLVDILHQNTDHWQSPLDCALATLSLLNFHEDASLLKKNIQYLLNTQQAGHWGPALFYLDINPTRDRSHYAGSSALTTAFCLEAYSRYENAVKQQSSVQFPSPKKQKKNGIELIQAKIESEVIRRFSLFPHEFQEIANAVLTDMLQKDSKHQIALLPYYFTATLGTNGAAVEDSFLIRLGVANTLGWLAYTIYDNVWDEESDPKTLSIANVALREIAEIFSSILPSQPEFYSFYRDTMDTMEWSNLWEVLHCRMKITNGTFAVSSYSLPEFGSYEKLAQKSFGHALGPIAILYSLGFTNKSSEMNNLLGFLRHYLIARQLNDDAHDWQSDLAKGQVTAVVAKILSLYKTTYPDKAIVLQRKLAVFQELFWDSVIVDVCHDIQIHVNASRRYLNELMLISYPQLFEDMLQTIERSAKTAISEREKTLSFIGAYSKEQSSP